MGKATQDGLSLLVPVGGAIPGVQGSPSQVQGPYWARSGAGLSPAASFRLGVHEKEVSLHAGIGEFRAQLPFSKRDLRSEEATGDKRLQRSS